MDHVKRPAVSIDSSPSISQRNSLLCKCSHYSQISPHLNSVEVKRHLMMLRLRMGPMLSCMWAAE